MRKWIWMFLALSACNSEPASVDEKLDPLARERGRILFRERCALCHGERADGRGVRASGLDRRPSDFNSAEWRRAKNARDIAAVIRDGRRGTPMPASPMLSDAEVQDLTVYVLSVSGHGP